MLPRRLGRRPATGSDEQTAADALDHLTEKGEAEVFVNETDAYLIVAGKSIVHCERDWLSFHANAPRYPPTGRRPPAGRGPGRHVNRAGQSTPHSQKDLSPRFYVTGGRHEDAFV